MLFILFKFKTKIDQYYKIWNIILCINEYIYSGWKNYHGEFINGWEEGDATITYYNSQGRREIGEMGN